MSAEYNLEFPLINCIHGNMIETFNVIKINKNKKNKKLFMEIQYESINFRLADE